MDIKIKIEVPNLAFRKLLFKERKEEDRKLGSSSRRSRQCAPASGESSHVDEKQRSRLFLTSWYK